MTLYEKSRRDFDEWCFVTKRKRMWNYSRYELYLAFEAGIRHERARKRQFAVRGRK